MVILLPSLEQIKFYLEVEIADCLLLHMMCDVVVLNYNKITAIIAITSICKPSLFVKQGGGVSYSHPTLFNQIFSVIPEMKLGLSAKNLISNILVLYVTLHMTSDVI